MAHYKEMTATGVAVGYPCHLRGIIVNSDSAAGYIYLNNNASAASGDIVAYIKVATDEDSKSIWFGEEGVECSSGIYMTESGCDKAYIYYS